MVESEPVKNIYKSLMHGEDKNLCQKCLSVSDMGDVTDKRTFIQTGDESDFA